MTAVTLATEFGCFSRFEKAGQVMSYTGVVPSEHSSGPKTRRGAITKTGNSHLRRVLVESAWHYRHQPKLCKRQRSCSPRCRQRSQPSPGAPNSGCIAATGHSRTRASRARRSSPRSRASSPASSGRSALKPNALSNWARPHDRDCLTPRDTNQSTRSERVSGRPGQRWRILDYVVRSRPACPVRGSSRRIVTMKAAKADPRISA